MIYKMPSFDRRVWEYYWNMHKRKLKTIEDQEQKQISAIKEIGKQLANTNTNANSYKNELLISKEREIYKNICNETLDKIEVLANKINYIDSKLLKVVAKKLILV